MWRSLMADDVDEYDAFVSVVRSASTADEANKRLAAVGLPRLRDRMARLDEYVVRPLRVADPLRHLDNALGFVLAAMERPDLSDELRRVPRTAAYRMIVGYMKAFLVRANEYCYRAAERGAPPGLVVLRESTYRRHMLAAGGPCARLFPDGGGRWMGRLDRRRVRGAVRHVFAGWEPSDEACDVRDPRDMTLDMFLVYDQYERLARHGVMSLAPGGREFSHASVPDDPAHLELLRSFMRAQYTIAYLDRLMRSLCRTFAPALLEAIAAAYVVQCDAGGAHLLHPNTVTEAVRLLGVPWFAEGTETPEPADLYYAHGGFHSDS